MIKENPLSAPPQALAQAMKEAQTCIDAQLNSPVQMIPDLAGHLIHAGGKQVRPAIVLASAMLGGGAKGAIELAAAVELMHSATLLHDDVVDEADARRGKQAARKVWGNQASILVGDFLLGRAFELMVTAGSLPCLQILSRAASRIAAGEVMQLSIAQKIESTEEDYFNVIRAKTAELFAAAAQAGAQLTGDEELADSMRGYGLSLGIGFQLMDDVLDYQQTSEVMGKQAGQDLREGKITLPVLLSYQRSGAKERQFWQRVIIEKQCFPADLQAARALMEKQGVFDDMFARAEKEAEQAAAQLGRHRESELGEWLAALAFYCARRPS